MSAETNDVRKTGSGSSYTAKDFILLAVFGVVIFLFFMILSMVLSFSIDFAYWTHAIGSLVGGIVWVYISARTPKRGAMAIMGLIMGIVAFLMGMMWTVPVGIVAGGVVAELVLVAGRRSAVSHMIAYAVFMLCWWIGQVALLLFASDTYMQTMVSSGMSAEYAEAVIAWSHGPMCAAAAVCTLIGGAVGAFFGTRLFKKHFAQLA